MRRILLLLAVALPLAAFAQDYPNRPVRMLVGYPAGGGMDAIARVVAAKLSESLGQPLVVENPRPRKSSSSPVGSSRLGT